MGSGHLLVTVTMAMNILDRTSGVLGEVRAYLYIPYELAIISTDGGGSTFPH